MRGGAAQTNKQKQSDKNREKRKKQNKIKKIDKNYHNVVYEWVKSEDYLRGVNPLTPILFRNPHILKINHAYAPDSNPWFFFRYWCKSEESCLFSYSEHAVLIPSKTSSTSWQKKDKMGGTEGNIIVSNQDMNKDHLST